MITKAFEIGINAKSMEEHQKLVQQLFLPEEVMAIVSLCVSSITPDLDGELLQRINMILGKMILGLPVETQSHLLKAIRLRGIKISLHDGQEDFDKAGEMVNDLLKKAKK